VRESRGRRLRICSTGDTSGLRTGASCQSRSLYAKVESETDRDVHQPVRSPRIAGEQGTTTREGRETEFEVIVSVGVGLLTRRGCSLGARPHSRNGLADLSPRLSL
jgi:hypothetical protein